MATQVFIVSGTTWTVPSNYTAAGSVVEDIGGGGGGHSGNNIGAGGGGGSYAKTTNVSVSGVVTVAIGAGGGGVSSGTAGNGGTTSFGAAPILSANGGSGGSSTAGGSGGTGGTGGSTTFNGGTGGTFSAGSGGGGGGGGAAGPNGNGTNGGTDSSTSGSQEGSGGGAGSGGSAGTNNSTNSTFVGTAGGAGFSGSAGGLGGIPETWSSTQINSNITGGGTNTVTNGSTNTATLVFGNVGVTTNKWYWETSITTTDLGNIGEGIGNTSSATANADYIGEGEDTAGLAFNAGNSEQMFLLWNNGNGWITNPAIAGVSGDRIAHALDMVNNSYWINNLTQGTGWLGGNGGQAALVGTPATNTNGFSLTNTGSTITSHAVVPCLSFFTNGDVGHGYFAPSSWQGSAPTGFGAFTIARSGSSGSGGGGGAGNQNGVVLATAGGTGGNGIEWTSAGAGGGGGGGGGSAVAASASGAAGGAGGLYGGGGGGSGNSSTGSSLSGANGAQGIIVVTYTPTQAIGSYTASSAIVLSGGAGGFLVNDKLSIFGGAFTAQAIANVASVNAAGQVLTVTVSTAGAYTNPPAGVVTVTGGSGTGNVTLSVSWAGVNQTPIRRRPLWIVRRFQNPALKFSALRRKKASKIPGALQKPRGMRPRWKFRDRPRSYLVAQTRRRQRVALGLGTVPRPKRKTVDSVKWNIRAKTANANVATRCLIRRLRRNTAGPSPMVPPPNVTFTFTPPSPVTIYDNTPPGTVVQTFTVTYTISGAPFIGSVQFTPTGNPGNLFSITQIGPNVYNLILATSTPSTMSTQGVQLQATPLAYTAASGIVLSGGAGGFTVGNFLTVVGGTYYAQAVFTVTAVNASGQVTAVSVYNAGSYINPPTGIVVLSGGSGTGTVAASVSWNGVNQTPIRRQPFWTRKRSSANWLAEAVREQRKRRTIQGPQPKQVPSRKRPHWNFRQLNAGALGIWKQNRAHPRKFFVSVPFSATARGQKLKWKFRLPTAARIWIQQCQSRIKRKTLLAVPDPRGRKPRWSFRLPDARRIWLPIPKRRRVYKQLSATGIPRGIRPRWRFAQWRRLPQQHRPWYRSSIFQTITEYFHKRQPRARFLQYRRLPSQRRLARAIKVAPTLYPQLPRGRKPRWAFRQWRVLPRQALKGRKTFIGAPAQPRMKRPRWFVRPPVFVQNRKRHFRIQFLQRFPARRPSRWTRPKWFPRMQYRKPRRTYLWTETTKRQPKRWLRKSWFPTVRALTKRRISSLYQQLPTRNPPLTRIAHWIARFSKRPVQRQKIRRLWTAATALPWRRPQRCKRTQFWRRLPVQIGKRRVPLYVMPKPVARRPHWRFIARRPAAKQKVRGLLIQFGATYNSAYQRRRFPRWRFISARRLPTQKQRRVFKQASATQVPVRRRQVQWITRRAPSTWRPMRKRRSTFLWTCERFVRHRPQRWSRTGLWRQCRKRLAYPTFPQQPTRRIVSRVGNHVWRRKLWFPPCKGPKRVAIGVSTTLVQPTPISVFNPGRMLRSPGKVRLLSARPQVNGVL